MRESQAFSCLRHIIYEIIYDCPYCKRVKTYEAKDVKGIIERSCGSCKSRYIVQWDFKDDYLEI